MGPKGPEGDPGGPKDAGPGEWRSMLHRADRCSFQEGTKADTPTAETMF
jgi:hypothetical protein